MRQRVASASIVKSAVLRVLRAARELAVADPDWSGGPSEYDYLTAEQIANLIPLDPSWLTLEYEAPSASRVLRHLWALEADARVWTWGDGTPTVATRRWALSND